MMPEAATLAGVTGAAIVDRSKALGLTWTLRPATVLAYSDSGTVCRITFDGDTAEVEALNLVGPVFQGDRVQGLILPPGGNFIVGRLGFYAPATLVASDSSTTSSGAFTAELAVLTIAAFTARAGHAYKVEFVNDIQSSTGTNAAIWRIRKTASVTGTLKGIGVWPLRGTASDDRNSNMMFRNATAADVTDAVVLSLEATAGTINRLASTTQVAYLRIWDVGPAEDHPLAIQF